jgi:hypothetical protein
MRYEKPIVMDLSAAARLPPSSPAAWFCDQAQAAGLFPDSLPESRTRKVEWKS